MRITVWGGGIIYLAVVGGVAWPSPASGQERRSSIVRECVDGPQCVPITAHVLVIRVVDAGDAVLPAVPVQIVRATDGAESPQTLALWRTDKDGTAGGTLFSGDAYMIRVALPGFDAFESAARIAQGATTTVVTVRLHVAVPERIIR
jgi:hypothetical protein